MNYPTEVLLSITSGILLSDFSAMHECVEFLAGEPVFTHQLAYKAFTEELKKAVLFQCPTLDSPEISVTAIGKLVLMLERAPKNDVGNLIKGWLEKYVYPVAGREMNLEPMPNMRHAEESFTKPLDGKQVIVVGGGEL